MKYPLISNYREAVMNPEGRFATLKNVVVERDEDSLPIARVSSCRVDFRISCDRGKSTLICSLSDSFNSVIDINILSKYIRDKNSEFLMKFDLLCSEMYVYDNKDNGAYYDVVVRERLYGDSIEKMITKYVVKPDTKHLRRTFNAFVNFALTLLTTEEFVHGSLKPTNVFLTNTSRIKLIDYRTIRIPGCDDWKESLHLDNVPLMLLSLLLVAAMKYPRQIAREEIVTMEDIRRIVFELMPGSRIDGVAELLALIQSGCNDKELICRHIERLSKAEILTEYENKEEEFFVENESYEGLSAARKGNKWGYVREGRVVIPFDYDWVGDFEEGLAVVKKDNNFGVIHISGKEVLPVEFEDVSWYSDNGVIIAGNFGNKKLYKRDGSLVFRNAYDNIGDFSCSLAWASKHGKYGFIDVTGRIVIPFIYDEVSSFGNNGVAYVIENGRSHIIDTSGEKVE